MTEEFVFDGMYCKKWTSDSETAVIQIIHGLGEMTEYYEQFAECVNGRGVSVYLAEMRYHGRTRLAVDVDDLLDVMADESISLTEKIRETHSAPIILLGHSMGAYIAQLMLQKRGELYRGAVLTGCACLENLPQLQTAIDKEIAEKGADAPCMEVFMQVFGRVTERFPEKCTVSWVTSDLERAEYYEKLPYTNVMYSNRFYKSFIDTAARVQDEQFPTLIRHKCPVFIACGADDSVGGYGEYPPIRAEEYKKAGFDVKLKVYENMRHSVLQEKRRDIVTEDIIDFVRDIV